MYSNNSKKVVNLPLAGFSAKATLSGLFHNGLSKLWADKSVDDTIDTAIDSHHNITDVTKQYCPHRKGSSIEREVKKVSSMLKLATRCHPLSKTLIYYTLSIQPTSLYRGCHLG